MILVVGGDDCRMMILIVGDGIRGVDYGDGDGGDDDGDGAVVGAVVVVVVVDVIAVVRVVEGYHEITGSLLNWNE